MNNISINDHFENPIWVLDEQSRATAQILSKAHRGNRCVFCGSRGTKELVCAECMKEQSAIGPFRRGLWTD